MRYQLARLIAPEGADYTGWLVWTEADKPTLKDGLRHLYVKGEVFKSNDDKSHLYHKTNLYYLHENMRIFSQIKTEILELLPFFATRRPLAIQTWDKRKGESLPVEILTYNQAA